MDTIKVNFIQDRHLLIPAFLELRGLVKQHIDSFNYLINYDIKDIVKAPSNCMIKSDYDSNFYLKYTDIRILTPCIEEDCVLYSLTPHECRIRDITYAAPIM
jgi:DNA-directed RNA polymerase III subunit RPC2